MDSKLYEYSNEEVIRILISAGTDIEAKNGVEWTSLTIACFNQDESVVKLLLESGANPNAFHENRHTNILDYACLRRRIKIIKLLLRAGGRNGPDFLLYKLDHPLFIAASNNDVELIKLLIELGYDLNIRDIGGRTPLILAAMAGHENIVQVLVDAGADTDFYDDDREFTALGWAMRARNVNIVKILTEAKSGHSEGEEYSRQHIKTHYRELRKT